MYIPLSGDKHWKVRDSSKKVHWKSETNSVWNKMQSKTKFSLRIFFLMVGKKIFLDWILSQTEFVSDYIPQLYFICNLLIKILVAEYGKKMNRSGIEISLADLHICNFIQSKFRVITCNWILQSRISLRLFGLVAMYNVTMCNVMYISMSPCIVICIMVYITLPCIGGSDETKIIYSAWRPHKVNIITFMTVLLIQF